MLKKTLNLNWILLLAITGIFVSCSTTEELDDLSTDTTNAVTTDALEEYAYEAVYRMQESGSIGRLGCFELVFPITVVFPDESSLTVEDYETMISAFMTWKENNPDVEGRPTFEFPIEILNGEGEILTIESTEDLRTLKRSCGRPFGDRPRGRYNCSCFQLQFPVTLAFPDGATEEVEDRQAMKQAIRVWKQNNEDSEEKPSLSFPITVVLEDGTEQTLNSQEELEALKESCGE